MALPLTLLIQAITPTLIIILAALQLTSNDVHSRLTRSKTANIFKPRHAGGSTTVPLDTMNFAANEAILTAPPKSSFLSDIVSSASSTPAESGSFGKPEGHVSFA